MPKVPKVKSCVEKALEGAWKLLEQPVNTDIPDFSCRPFAPLYTNKQMKDLLDNRTDIAYAKGVCYGIAAADIDNERLNKLISSFPFGLKKVDLSLRNGCDHAGIIADHNKQYLAKISGRWVIGTFNRQWYGLNFSREYDVTCGHQLNSSDWEKLFEIL